MCRRIHTPIYTCTYKASNGVCMKLSLSTYIMYTHIAACICVHYRYTEKDLDIATMQACMFTRSLVQQQEKGKMVMGQQRRMSRQLSVSGVLWPYAERCLEINHRGKNIGTSRDPQAARKRQKRTQRGRDNSSQRQNRDSNSHREKPEGGVRGRGRAIDRGSRTLETVTEIAELPGRRSRNR